MNDNLKVHYCNYSDRVSEAIEKYRKFYRKSPCRAILNGKNWYPSKYANFDLENEQLISIQQLEKSICLNYPNRYTKLIREKEMKNIFVGEALIQTYPVKNLLDRYIKWFEKNVDERLQDITISNIMGQRNKHLMKDFFGKNASLDTKLKSYVEIQDDSFDDPDINGIVTFYVPMFINQKKNFNKTLISLADSLYVCGWNLANHSIFHLDENDEICILMITFEAKYFDIDFEFGKYLYHVTKSSSLKKIDKNGLVPRSQNAIYTYPDRVYLFNNISPNEMIDYMYEKMNGDNDNKFALLRIDSSKLQNDPLYKNGKMKFYIDQKYPTETHQHPVAIFTYNNIPRRLIDDEVVVYSLDENGILTDKQKIDQNLQRVNKIK